MSNMLPTPNGGNDSKNLITAVIISALLFFAMEFFLGTMYPKPEDTNKTPVETTADSLTPTMLAEDVQANLPTAISPANFAKKVTTPFESMNFTGEISTKGARLETLILNNFENTDYTQGLPWFTPTGEHLQYADSGWLGTGVIVPTTQDFWEPTGGSNLVWSNPQGQVFERTFTDSGNQVITITDKVTNNGTAPISLQHYAQIVHGGEGLKGELSSWFNFFGPLGLVDDILVEEDWGDIRKNKISHQTTGGWWGFSTQYFLTSIIPPAGVETVRSFSHNKIAGQNLYSASVQRLPVTLAPGQTAEVKTPIYIGPKSGGYLNAANHNLDRALNYGWFHMIALPMYKALVWLHSYLGNWGLAIIGLTIIVKVLFFPLTYKSFVSMAKMRKLQPEMKAMQEKYKGNKDAQHKMGAEMMALYKKHGANPLSGCWPMLIQMPIFFAMYKVMLISFEFRGAPFYGWITDLSLQDPYFVLPIVMGASMWVQMNLNPTTGDPIQQKVMKFLPIIFTAMFLFFPSGLVLYWLVNNLITIAQQLYVLKRVE